MRFLHRVWMDFARGENVDLYVTAVLAILLAGLNIAGLSSSPLASSLTPVVLTLIAVSLLNDRHLRKEQNRVLQELNDVGIEKAFEQLPQETLNQKYQQARREARILTTWMPGINPFSPILADLIRREIPLKILIIDPSSELISYRIRDHNLNTDTYPSAALDALVASIKRHKLRNQNLIEIRMYSVLPPFYLRMVDEWMLIGLYWHGYGSSEGPMFSITNKSSKFGKFILETFDNIWDSAKALSLDEYSAISNKVGTGSS